MYRKRKTSNKLTIQSTNIEANGDTSYNCIDKSGNQWEICERYRRNKYDNKRSEFLDKKRMLALKFARCGSLTLELLAEKIDIGMTDLLWIVDHCRSQMRYPFRSGFDIDKKTFNVVDGCVTVQMVGRQGAEEFPSHFYFDTYIIPPDSSKPSNPVQKRLIAWCHGLEHMALVVKRIDESTFIIGNIRRYKKDKWMTARPSRSSERRLAISDQLMDMEPEVPPKSGCPSPSDIWDVWCTDTQEDFESGKTYSPTSADLIDKELGQRFENSSAYRRAERQKRKMVARSLREMVAEF